MKVKGHFTLLTFDQEWRSSKLATSISQGPLTRNRRAPFSQSSSTCPGAMAGRGCKRPPKNVTGSSNKHIYYLPQGPFQTSSSNTRYFSTSRSVADIHEQRLSLRSRHCVNSSLFSICSTIRSIAAPVDREFESPAKYEGRTSRPY
jgi:hypothetical protein